jgi:uncharacterized protein YcbX
MPPELSRLTIYPIKSLDPEECDSVRIAERGRLALDREYAIVARSADEEHDPETSSVGGRGAYMNGKRTDAVHRLRSTFDPESGTLALRINGEENRHEFDIDDSPDLNAWLSEYFDQPVSVRRESTGGYPDDRALSGPTVISTATLQEVASWFPSIDVDGMRRRFRANIEIDGVPAFWEDRLFAGYDEHVTFCIGSVRFEGVNPCQRCVVPTRDPDTGKQTMGFREIFIERRKATVPEWVDRERFDHHYRLMVNTRVPKPEEGKTIHIGDTVEIT